MFRLSSCIIALGVGAILFILLHLQRTYRARRWIRNQREAGLPMPEHHALLGHLPIVNDTINALPPNCAVDVAISNIAREFPTGVFYLDFAPFDKPNIIVTSPDVAAQVQKLTQLGKPDYVAGVVNTICGGRNLFTMSGQVGKLWRNTFNRGFSVAYMQTLAPMIAREVEVFAEIIEKKAKSGEIVKLLEPVTKLAVDVITSVGLDARLGYQEKEGVLSSIMMSQLQWAGFSAAMNPWKVLNPIRPLILWYNKRQIHKILGAEVDNRFVELGLEKGSGALHSKSAISLALQEIASSIRPNNRSAAKVEKAQKASMVSQIMLFLMAGQDTTSSTITYCIRELYAHRATLNRIRAEHSEVFGNDLSPSHITNAIEEHPERINHLPYTSAVIKETLRLHPPASALRKGEPGVTLTDNEGNIYPTEGCNIWVVHAAMHRDPRYFIEPDSFIPERWLVELGDPLCPVKGAWRPFETGTRNCLGQTLATLAIKISLLMVARNYEISEAYNEVETKDHPKVGAGAKAPGIEGRNFGDAYPVYGIGLAVLPNGGFPCHIKSLSTKDCN
ncbi:aflN/ verA/ monooxygenase [Phaeosphaeria sp. MPI-PUGE-AT-0046c]|nr:aflN/ verA/ monooxygenase [Phaeosphaeria sp. MPI-PUGE-AT-0046c]